MKNKKLEIAKEITKELVVSPHLFNIIRRQPSSNILKDDGISPEDIAGKAMEIADELIMGCNN